MSPTFFFRLSKFQQREAQHSTRQIPETYIILIQNNICKIFNMSLLRSLLHQDNLLDHFWGNSFLETPDVQMDWKETPHAHIFYIDLPGLTKGDVKLEIHEGRVLHITAERKEEGADDKGVKWHCRERKAGTLAREFRLPENVKVDEIKASMHDGVLIVTVPKDEHQKKSKQYKAVEIAGKGQNRDPKGLSRFVCCKA